MYYVIQVAPREEQKIVNLIKGAVPKEICRKCFFPMRDIRRKIRGEFVDFREKLFPGYIFLESDAPMETYLDLKTIPLFKVMLKSGDDFAPLAPAEEAILKQLLGEDKRVDVSIGTMEEGKLKILSGPIKGMEKYIIRVDKHKRKALLQMQMLRKVVEYNVALELV